MIATSPDGQWAAVKRGREVMLLAGGAGPAAARIELPTDDADLVMVGPPWKRSQRFITRSRKIDMSPSIAPAKAKFMATPFCSVVP